MKDIVLKKRYTHSLDYDWEGVCISDGAYWESLVMTPESKSEMEENQKEIMHVLEESGITYGCLRSNTVGSNAYYSVSGIEADNSQIEELVNALNKVVDGLELQMQKPA